MSIADVGAESGVDKRTVRYHFGSKRHLFVAARADGECDTTANPRAATCGT